MPNEESIVRGIITLLETLPCNKEMSAKIEKTICGPKSKAKAVLNEVDWATLFSWQVKQGIQKHPAPNTYYCLSILYDLLVYEHPSVARIAAATNAVEQEAAQQTEQHISDHEAK